MSRPPERQVSPKQPSQLVAPTYAALPSRIVACEQVLDFLDAVAMHPQARRIIATAKTDLDTMSRQIARNSKAALRNHFDGSLSLAETGVERVREAIGAGGPWHFP